MATQSPSHITTVLRYDKRFTSFPPDHSPYYLLHHNAQRLHNSAKAFGWPKACEFFETGDATAKLREVLEERITILSLQKEIDSSAWRIRVIMDRHGEISVEAQLAQPVVDAKMEQTFFPSFFSLKRESSDEAKETVPWVVYADPQPTVPTDFTRHKTTERTVYAEAKRRGCANLDGDSSTEVEILLWNPEGEVMEGCITSIYFHRPSHPNSRRESAWITPPLTSGGNDGTTRRYALDKGMCREKTIQVDELVDGELCWLSNGGKGFWTATLKKR